MTYQDRYPLAFRLYPYARSADQGAAAPAHHPVTIVGGGPVGVAVALDLALRGVPALVLDDHEGVGQGSRAICFAKRTLEIAHRLGCGPQMLDKGVVWNTGRVFHERDEVFSFDLLPEDGHRYPAFINLQQPWFERFLVEAVNRAQAEGAPIEIRGRNRLTAMQAGEEGVTLHLDTPDGPYTITTDWLIACDGAKSPIREMMGLGFEGRVFEGQFPDRRREDDRRFPDRALVLVRAVVQVGRLGAPAQAARRHLAHRFPAGLGHRPQGRA